MKKTMLIATSVIVYGLMANAQKIDPYVNADLHLLELMGPVHKCIEGLGDEAVTYVFDTNEKLESSYTALGEQAIENPQRDSHGRIVRYGSDEGNDMDGEPMYTFVEWGRMSPSIPETLRFSGPECDIVTKLLHTESKRPAFLVSSKVMVTDFPCNGGRVEYFYERFDKRGNWTQRLAVTTTKDSDTGKEYEERVMEFRKISYWDDDKLDMARLYLYGGSGVERDYDKAFLLFKELADSYPPNSDALWELGRMYHLGLGTKADISKAAWCYGHSYDMRNPYGMFWYAYCLDKGISANGVDKEKAQEIYLEVSKRLNAMIDNKTADHYTYEYLGRYFYDGITIEHNYDTAAKLFEKAAVDDNANALYMLGNIYNSLGPLFDPDEPRTNLVDDRKAEQMYEKAKAHGIADAQIELGDLQYSQQRYEEALKNYSEQASLGNDKGLFALGICYEKGKGVPADPEWAQFFYKQAAEKGNESAKEKLKEYK